MAGDDETLQLLVAALRNQSYVAAGAGQSPQLTATTMAVQGESQSYPAKPNSA